MTKQGFLFEIGESSGDKKKRLAWGKSATLGRCPCGFEGAVYRCEYCKRTFCEDCGSKNKVLCENCLMFYDTQDNTPLPPNPDGLSESSDL